MNQAVAWCLAEHVTASRGHGFLTRNFTRFAYLVCPVDIMILLGSDYPPCSESLAGFSWRLHCLSAVAQGVTH